MRPRNASARSLVRGIAIAGNPPHRLWRTVRALQRSRSSQKDRGRPRVAVDGAEPAEVHLKQAPLAQALRATRIPVGVVKDQQTVRSQELRRDLRTTSSRPPIDHNDIELAIERRDD